MRIIGYIEHPVLKITVFKMDTRLSIKFENSQAEQTYKLRPSEQVNTLSDIQQLVDEQLLKTILARFAAMQKDFDDARERHFPADGADDFPVIL